jgi:hypothetical protein
MTSPLAAGAPLSARERWVVCTLLLAAVLIYASPIFSPWNAQLGDNPDKANDWLKIASFEHFARQSLMHGRVALWSPYFGGGYPLIAHPEDGSLSPLTLPSYVFGEVVGMKIQLVVALFLGALGVYLTARRLLALGPEGAMTAALGLLFAGWMAWRVNYGWPMHFGYYLFPLAAYCTGRAVADRRWLIGAAALMTIVLQQIAQGLPVMFLVLLTIAVSLDLAGLRRTQRGQHTLLVLALAALTAAGGAFKVAGLLHLLGLNSRAVPYADYQPLTHFYASLADWGRFVIGGADVYYKNVGLGPWLVGLAAVGLVLAWRRVWPLLPALVLCVWLGLGPNAPLDLFGQLHRLPVFGSMHWPLKYFNFFVAFIVCLLAGGAVDFAAARIAVRLRPALFALALLPLAPLAWTHMQLLDRTFTKPLPALPAPGEFRQVAAYDGAPRGFHRVLAAHQYVLLRQNHGTVDWDGDLLLPEHAVPAERIQADGSRVPVPEYRGEVYLTGGGELREWRVDVNRLAAAGRADEAGFVVFNQNFDPAWRATTGSVGERDGLLAVPVAAGEFRVELRYRPMWFYLGLLISLLTWIALLAWLRFG